MADHDHLQAVGMVALGLDMHLGDERAGCVDEKHLALGGLCWHGLRDAMGRKDHRAVIGAIVKLFNKDRALVAQTIHDVFVVNDFVADVDRRAPFFERHFDDLDRAIHARAEAARCGQVQRKWRFFIHAQDLRLGMGFCPVRQGAAD